MRARHRAGLFLVGFWILPALVGTLGLRLVPSRLNPDLTLGQVLLSQLLIWLAWAAWSLMILATGSRFPFVRGRLGAAFAAHLPLMVVVVSGQILVVNLVTILFGMTEPRGLDSMLLIGVRQYGDLFTVVFWAIVGAQIAARWYTAWQTQTLVTAQLGQDLAEAQLRALQSQLNPHFLFNALNSVMTLIGTDPAAAQRTVVRLADLLRATLKSGEGQEITLEQELGLTRRYLELELIRFADRLTVEWMLEDLPAVLVPAFGLQPLVENAVVHGIGPKVGPGVIVVSARRDGDRLVLSVRDNGGGPHGRPGKEGGGVGLANLRARVARLYGDSASVTLAEAPEGGAVATLRLPYQPDPGGDTAAGQTQGAIGTDSSTVGASVVPDRRPPASSYFSH